MLSIDFDNGNTLPHELFEGAGRDSEFLDKFVASDEYHSDMIPIMYGTVQDYLQLIRITLPTDYEMTIYPRI